MTTEELKNKAIPASEAVKLVHDGDTVFIGLTCNQAFDLGEALYARKDELRDIRLISSMIMQPTSLFFGKDAADTFSVATPFAGVLERYAKKNGLNYDFTSYHLSQLDHWMRVTGRPNVLFLAVSKPDENGYVSFGPAGYCCYKTMLECADRVILEIVPDMPYVYGDESVRLHIDDADAVVLSSAGIPSVPNGPEDETSKIIADQILDLIPDGATIQLGIGNLSTVLGKSLKAKNDLGVFTELFTPPLADLMKSGNVTNKYKGFMDGLSVFAFSVGDPEMYEYMDYNKSMYAAPFEFVNDPRVICKNKNMISINTAMSMNLYGEVAAEGIGFNQYSAIGGQIDYVKGAQWSEGGKSIITMNSTYTDKTGTHSKIVLDFPVGTPVTTPRSEVQYVATEYGCVNLKDLTMGDRVRAMISLAHPDFRNDLTAQAKEMKLI